MICKCYSKNCTISVKELGLAIFHGMSSSEASMPRLLQKSVFLKHYSIVVTKLTQKTGHIDETPINIGAGEGNRTLREFAELCAMVRGSRPYRSINSLKKTGSPHGSARFSITKNN